MASRGVNRRSRPEKLRDVRGMDYAPTNEQGVVFLFALLHRKLGFRGIEKIQSGFPDCIARRVTGGREEEVRIEFEYRSSSFLAHGHSARGCDCIVCWEDDWAKRPAGLEIIELRSKCGLGHKVWMQAVRPEYWDELDKKGWKRYHWSVPSLAKKGDLILMYRTRPKMCVCDIVVMRGHVEPDKHWGYMADIGKVCRLKSPLTLNDMRDHPRLKDAGFVRASIQGRPQVTARWPDLYGLICDLNPSLRRTLKAYAPERFTVPS